MYFCSIVVAYIIGLMLFFHSGFDRDPKTSKFEIYCRIPELAIVGHYKVAGKVIILPVVGEGPANLTFGNFIKIMNRLVGCTIQYSQII